MRVEKGKSYTCETCTCELLATKSADMTTTNCDLMCCGELMKESPRNKKR